MNARLVVWHLEYSYLIYDSTTQQNKQPVALPSQPSKWCCHPNHAALLVHVFLQYAALQRDDRGLSDHCVQSCEHGSCPLPWPCGRIQEVQGDLLNVRMPRCSRHGQRTEDSVPQSQIVGDRERDALDTCQSLCHSGTVLSRGP